jgi:hypothetical protein
MRWTATLLAFLIGSAVARADPGQAEAALDLQIFLERQTGVEHRVLDFRIIAEQKFSDTRKHVRYQARIEFPRGLSPQARQTLKNADVKWIVGALDEYSSKPVRIEISREARFRKSFSRWNTLVGNTYFPVK